MNEIKLIKEYITLDQLLQEAGVINTGGMAKWFLSEYEVYVNGELDDRRGRKLYNQDKVMIPGVGEFVVSS
ncbi:S4 domain-containing protein YaaA [Guptibacillus hwajinpoensis]|uniref:S4 domain-containing protein YaaA n=1 Tax=Guptibacillus hwajinpoensis TaxID=208199 RepID=UPI00273E107B|nr:S4 domain-containing protein YaaA [Pseudalkalibacillus hwajinpoensis]WLR57992.1 S4 domain-containing protein YaaA [Pseudalkalibacillus hwajinpoensis]